MRTTTDAFRSLARYSAQVLGDEYEVRFWGDEGQFGLPFALVKLSGPTLYNGSANFADAVQPFAIYCYTEPADTVEESMMRALDVEEVLFTGFRMGVALGAPARVPLYDYASVPLDGINAGTNVRRDSDYMRIADFQVNRLPDPEDDRVIVVAAELRATWRRRTRTFPGNPVESIEMSLEEAR